MADKRTVYEIIKDGCPNCKGTEDLWVEWSVIESSGVRLSDPDYGEKPDGIWVDSPTQQLEQVPVPFTVHCNNCNYEEKAMDWGAELAF